MKRITLIAITLIAISVALFATPARAQVSGGATTLFNGYTGTDYSAGFTVRNQAAGAGTWMSNGRGNWGIVGVTNPATQPGTVPSSGAGSGGYFVAANNVENFGTIGRATTYRSGALNVGGAFWSVNHNPIPGSPDDDKRLGLYVALSDLPANSHAFATSIDTSAVAMLDSVQERSPVLVLKQRGLTVLDVPDGGQLQLHTQGTKPTCDVARRGSFWYGAGAAGTGDTFEVCIKDAGDLYSWRSVVVPFL